MPRPACLNCGVELVQRAFLNDPNVESVLWRCERVPACRPLHPSLDVGKLLVGDVVDQAVGAIVAAAGGSA